MHPTHTRDRRKVARTSEITPTGRPPAPAELGSILGQDRYGSR